jgi:nucleotide-binding universal stress UspA family protein
VLVGVDGSLGSRRALAWAANEARQHNAELHVLTAWLPPVPPVGIGYAGYVTDLPDAGQIAAREQADTVERELGDSPDVMVKQETIEGHAAERLIEASADADLVVVGCRGHGGFTGMLLGSVSQHLAAHAKCPVTVIR